MGLDWFLVVTEASGGGTPDLGFFLGVSVFIGIFGVENKSGGPTESPRGTGARPPPSWGPRDSPPVTLRSVKFQVNWTPFDFPFLQYSKTRKNRNWHWALG